MTQREIKHNFKKSIKAAPAASLEKGVYAARRYGVTKMQQRAMKEINRLQEEGWELPQSTINRAKSNQQRISAKQYEAYCQGIIDCVQILSGLGLLESDGKIERAIEKLK